MNTADIVQKLCNLCNVLRDDGVTYHQYVTELTWLLFLKMVKETDREEQLPEGYRWDDLETKTGIELLKFYRGLLLHLGSAGSPRVQAIFANASTSLKEPRNLRKLVESIDELDWYSAKSEGLGDLYEGLLEKNASEKKSGAGQYFTPRPLIDAMVAVVKPKPGELVQDPAAGTAGFLIAADRQIKAETDELFSLTRNTIHCVKDCQALTPRSSPPRFAARCWSVTPADLRRVAQMSDRSATQSLIGRRDAHVPSAPPEWSNMDRSPSTVEDRGQRGWWAHA